MTLRRREYLGEVNASSFGIKNGDRIVITTWSSKKKKAGNPAPDSPNFVVFASAFGGYDIRGEGATKKEALQNAIDTLPDHIRSHFV